MNNCPWTLKDVFIVFMYTVALFFVFCFWLTVIFLLIIFGLGSSRHAMDMLAGSLWAKDMMVVLLFYVSLLIVMKIKIFNKYRIAVFDFFVQRSSIKSDVVYGFVMYLKFSAFFVLGVALLFIGAIVWEMIFGSGILEKINMFFGASEIEAAVSKEKIAGFLGVLTIFAIGPFFEELFSVGACIGLCVSA